MFQFSLSAAALGLLLYGINPLVGLIGKLGMQYRELLIIGDTCRTQGH